MLNSIWFILDENNKPVPATSDEYIEWKNSDSGKCTVGKTYIGKTFISTVFLALDHGILSSEKILWETMVFGYESKDEDEFQERYSSFEDAKAGHEKAVKAVINGEKLEYS